MAPHDGLGALMFEFAADQYLLAEIASDAETLKVSRSHWVDPFEGALSAEDIAFLQSNGQHMLVDESQSAPYASLIGQPVVAFEALVDQFGIMSGLSVSTPSSKIWFINGGDEGEVRWSEPINYRSVGHILRLLT